MCARCNRSQDQNRAGPQPVGFEESGRSEKAQQTGVCVFGAKWYSRCRRFIFLPRRLGLAVSAQRAGATGTACVRGEPQKSERKPSEGLEAAGEASLSAHASPAFQNAALSATLSDLDLQSRNVVVVVTSTAYRQAVAVKTPPLKC